MASLIAILDLKGKPLIQRSYRDDVPPSYIERFLPLVLEIEEEGQQLTPCLSSQGINYMHIRHSNLYCMVVFSFSFIIGSDSATVLALSKRNSNVAEIIVFLHRLIQVLVEYVKELEEESIRDNFVIIYELMDDGLWVPSDDRKQNSTRVHYPATTQARDSEHTDCSHQCRIVENGGDQISEERGVLGCHRERQYAGARNCFAFFDSRPFSYSELFSMGRLTRTATL